MHIVIDARFTSLDQHDGISRYGASLLRALAETVAHATAENPEVDYRITMLIYDERQLKLLPALPHVRINSPRSPTELMVARRVNKLQPDVVFCPLQTMGSFGRHYPLILTLHDLIYYENPTPPGFLPLPVRVLWRLYHMAYWPQRLLLNRADVVATISRTTAALIADHRLTRRPVVILGNAPLPGTIPRDASDGRDKSLVYMGSFMLYKNVETIVAGMAHLPGYTLHLLSRISVSRQRELEDLLPAVHAGGGRVQFHHGVSDAEYNQLLKRATALVTLSRAEGYGLPVIEAMAAGTPVVAADTAIFREVGADAALYTGTESASDFAAAVTSLEEPGRWEWHSWAGIRRAAAYNWADSARSFLATATSLVEKHAQRRSSPY